MLKRKMNLSEYINEAKQSKNKIILFLSVFLVLIWLESTLSNAVDFDKIDESDTETNHFLNDFSIEQTDGDGNIKWTLDGDRLEKFPNSDRSEVINPKMYVKSSEESSWRVTASHALDPDSEFNTIYLTDNVKFEKKSMAEETEVFITTTRAIIYPEEDKVETDAFATIITPNSKTTGDGVIANIKEGYVKILANAKRIASTEKLSENLQGDQLLYNLSKKTWVVIKKVQKNEKNQVRERVKTILKTKKKELTN